jgi:hypothetical protein
MATRTNNATALLATDRTLQPVKISTLTGKLEGFRAVNTNTLSNTFCMDMHKKDDPEIVCTDCYSVDMLRGSRKNCVSPWEQNSVTLSQAPLTPAQIPFINDAVFRYSAHGELINETHLENLALIAESNPRTFFVLWTKRKDLVYAVFGKELQNKPANLSLIYSNPRTDKIIKTAPRGFDKVFNVIGAEHRKPTTDVNCHSKCKDCMICYSRNDVQVIVELKKKRS